MSDLTPLEQKIASKLADDLQKDLEQFKNNASRNMFNSKFSGIFKQNENGTISIVRPIPFEPK